ncbi:MAG: hypothetical protein U1D30_07925 [Planctomycetota bacterium]
MQRKKGRALSDKPRNKSRLLWNLLRWVVTLAAVGYVLSQITWKDRLLVPGADGKQIALSGWLTLEDGKEVFQADDGRGLPILPEDRAEKFVPGFWTLLKGIDRSLLILAFAMYIQYPSCCSLGAGNCSCVRMISTQVI